MKLHLAPVGSRPQLGTLFLLVSLLAPATGVAQTSSPPAAAGKDADSTVKLDPFEVQADSDTSYGALNSNSITAFKTELDHLPISADIYDQAFMNDVGATSVEAMISTYSAGAGPSALSAGATAFENQPGDRVNLSYTQLRGMQTPNVQRDSLLFLGTLGGPGGTSIGFTSNFDIERVEIIDGPQALLYDGGGAGGVINLVSKQARIDSPTFGSVTFRTDMWGSKYGMLDYGASEGKFAVRVALLDTADDTRRVNVGDKISGTYVQFAGILGKTTVRLSLEQVVDYRVNSTYQSVTDTTGDTSFQLNSDSLGYLLATNQAKGIDNGLLNWSNVNSLQGDTAADTTVSEFATLAVDTQWTSWLSTQLSAGLSGFTDDHIMDSGAVAFYAPGATSNPLPGNWTLGMTGAFSAEDGVRPYRGQGLRGSVLMTNELFAGRAKSQSIFGLDTVDNRGGIIQYAYYQADSNWNIVTNPSVTANLGRTVLPKLAWTVNNGGVLYPLFRIGAPRITYNGINYVRAQQNPFVPSLRSEANPTGANLIGGANGLRNDDINTGAYAVNYTQWMGGKLDTLLGMRLEHAYTYTARPQTVIPNATPIEIIDSHSFNFDAGADYHVLPWLAPYFTVSDSYLLAPDLQNDPYGSPLPVSQALGQEVGIKVNNASKSISGSLSLYHVATKNEEFLMTATLENDINPSGLNSRFDSDATNGYSANARAEGVELKMTASPTNNWRMRLSAAFTNGTIESTKVYPELYNDQFNENSSGQVTYADGTVVFVNPAFNSKMLTVPAGTAGAIPLTVTALSTPGGAYYASPVAGSGVILATSNAAKVLGVVDPAHGAILTGANGLPISAYQLNPALTGIAAPGAIAVAVAGEDTTGYPEYSANFTSVYTFSSGWLKGFEAGGTASASWKLRSFYYYPNGLTTAGPLSPRSLFGMPDITRFDLILGYSRKFARLTFSSQLNVYNLFNRYQVVISPDVVTGFNTASNLNANFNQQPRSYVWTNRISF